MRQFDRVDEKKGGKMFSVKTTAKDYRNMKTVRSFHEIHRRMRQEKKRGKVRDALFTKPSLRRGEEVRERTPSLFRSLTFAPRGNFLSNQRRGDRHGNF